MNRLQQWAAVAALLGTASLAQADSDLLAHIACQAEISALGAQRGLDLDTQQTYVDPTEEDNHRYYINATSNAGAYRATCLVTPRGRVLEAALDSGQWAYTKRRLGDGGDSREGLAVEDQRR